MSEIRLDLEQQKRRARELLRAARAGEPQALQRLRQTHPLLGGMSDAELRTTNPALHHAQLVIAREEGFASWPRLRFEAERRRSMRQTEPIERELSWYEDRAQGLVSTHEAGLANAFQQIREWHPRLHRATDEEIARTPFTIDDARLVYAREHGSSDWPAFSRRIEAIAGGTERPPFTMAFGALRSRDVDALQELIERHPDLVDRRGTNGNTLLNLACSFATQTCDEDVRKVSIDAVRLLIEAGSDVDAPNERGWTPLHQSGVVAVARVLLEAGAAIDREAHGPGGTPLANALFWGNREVADELARYGLVPRNLRIAAGLGRAGLIEQLVDAQGHLAPEAFAARGFYRPHSGFPVWHPSDDEREVLDEALVWACKSDRVDVLPRLVELGAGVDADPYRGTPLTWAACKGRIDAAAWLLDHGADVNRRATFGGPSHGEGVTALHLAAQNGDLDMVRLLVGRGADPTIEDANYQSSPLGWAEHFGHEDARRVLAAT